LVGAGGAGAAKKEKIGEKADKKVAGKETTLTNGNSILVYPKLK